MTHNEMIIAECAARQRGDLAEAERLRALRWERAMGLVVNCENCPPPHKSQASRNRSEKFGEEFEPNKRNPVW